MDEGSSAWRMFERRAWLANVWISIRERWKYVIVKRCGDRVGRALVCNYTVCIKM